MHLTAAPFSPPEPTHRVRLGIAKSPIDASNVFLYHKTTQRTVYQQMQQAHPEFEDVLLWNERGQLTESCIANLIVEWEDEWYTPPVECGLLAGTMRSRLLQQGKVKERVIRLEDLQHCSRLFLVNSVRQIQEASLLKSLV
uniref:Aminotransferase class IV n=1 Tax=Desertifilum tharense IPPAS B-1220 TaxID=1781255 RepID=A0ACD5H1U1_9CYAN